MDELEHFDRAVAALATNEDGRSGAASGGLPEQVPLLPGRCAGLKLPEH